MRLALIVGLAAATLVFQNCSNVGFNSEPSNSSSSTGSATSTVSPEDAFGNIAQGLKGGHFDLDTSSQAYPFSQGTTDHHVHEYDDKFNVTYADFFNLLDAKFKNIQENIPADTRFVLIIGNAQLSPGGVLSINGQNLSVVDYQNRVSQFMAGNTSALTVYTLSGATGQKLTGLRIGFTPDALLNGGLIGTETSCVVRNDPGKLGEYRNGALIIQAVDVNSLRLNPATKTADVNGGLLWESTIFWHWDGGCYK